MHRNKFVLFATSLPRLNIGCAITGLIATAVSNHAGRPADVWSNADSCVAKPSQAVYIGVIDSHCAADRHVLSDHERRFLLTRDETAELSGSVLETPLPYTDAIRTKRFQCRQRFRLFYTTLISRPSRKRSGSFLG